MNRLTQIEAARVISVLQTTYEKMKLLLDLDLNLISPEITAEFIPPDILADLMAQKELEAKFVELVETGKELREKGHRVLMNENQTQKREVGDKIKESSVKLERKLRESPQTVEQLQQLGQRTPEATQFLETFSLLVKLSKVRLETTKEEAAEKLKRMEVLAMKESKVLTDKAALKKEIDAETKTGAAENGALKENEYRLASMIAKIKAENKAFAAKCESDLITMTQKLKRDHEEAMVRLRDENARLTEELEATMRENKGREREMRKIKQQTSQEIENRIAGYDTGMLEKRNAQIRAEEKLEAERGQIAELETKIAELDRRAKMDEFKGVLDEKIEEARQAEKRLRHRQIGIIQGLFRRRQAMKIGDALRKAAARKKKKGGKGKKKKK